MFKNQDMNRNQVYATLVITYLFLFALIFNRRPILRAFGKESTVEVKKTIHHIRAESEWNIVHADSCVSLIQDGDIVLRAGTDRLSELFKKFNVYDQSYSHAGILMVENGYPMVYNMNAPSSNPFKPIRRDSIQRFVDPFENTSYAVYRSDLSVQKRKKLKRLLVDYYNQRVPFDPSFDLSTDSAFYGNELVYKTFLQITDDSTFFSTTMAGGYEFVTTDNLFYKQGNKLVCKIVYKQ